MILKNIILQIKNISFHMINTIGVVKTTHKISKENTELTSKTDIILGKHDICKDCAKADVCKHKENIEKDPILDMSVEQCKYFIDKFDKGGSKY